MVLPRGPHRSSVKHGNKNMNKNKAVDNNESNKMSLVDAENVMQSVMERASMKTTHIQDSTGTICQDPSTTEQPPQPLTAHQISRSESRKRMRIGKSQNNFKHDTKAETVHMNENFLSAKNTSFDTDNVKGEKEIFKDKEYSIEDDHIIDVKGNTNVMAQDDSQEEEVGDNIGDAIPVEEEEEEEEEEPDWDTIAQHEPARSDVPVFIAARDRRDAAESRFAAALDEAHASLKKCCDDLLKTAADLFNIQREKLDNMESQIKQDFVYNEEARSNMQKKLEESANAAQAQFTQLMMRVTQLGGISRNASSDPKRKKLKTSSSKHRAH